MSVIRKQPYIESLLGSMSTANLKDLRTILNSGGDNVSLSFATLTNSYKNKVTPVYFQFEDNGLKTGILIWTNSKCALICYHKYQDLLLIELNPTNHTYQKINEYCDINELRRVLDDTVESTGAIDSGNAAEGTVPIADGEGGVGWGDASNAIKGANVEEGNAIYLLGVDSEGNVIKDELPEGIVVDESLDEASTNAVANKPVAEAISDIQGDISDIETALETKANVDGNYPTMTVGAADNLTPYDEESGDDQDEPFNFQATGTGNGSQADFATGSLALMKEKRGNSVVVNQLLPVLSDLSWSATNATVSYNDGVATILATAQFGGIAKTIMGVAGHKYLYIFSVKTTTATTSIMTDLAYNSGTNHKYISIEATTNWQTLFAIIELTSGQITPSIQDNRASDRDSFQAKDVYLIDLTQWFGSNDNIPADLLAHPENWYRYYQGSLAYNAGQIVNANSRYIKCIGRQQWDEEWELGWIDGSGEDVSSSINIRSKNFIRVIPNEVYYVKSSYQIAPRYYDKNKNFISYGANVQNNTLTTPVNAIYMRFTTPDGISTYNNDITISLYYSGESGYDQYYAYEVLTNNDTGTEELKSAGSVADSKAPDGTITRNVGSVDLGTLNWSGSSGRYSTGELENLIKKPSSNSQLANIISPNYTNATANDESGSGSGEMFVRTDGTLVINSTSSPTGTLYYELETPTQEQGTPFSENLIIDDFGSMEFAGTSGVPQGNLIFYPVDYKAFIDTLYDYAEGTPSDIALKSDLSTAITTFLTGLTGYDATKTQVLKNIEGTLTWVDEEA